MRTALLSLMICMVVLLAVPQVFADDSCTACHENEGKMTASGYPHFMLSPAEVRTHTNIHAACADCHLGNPLATEKDEAHKGMLTVMAVDGKWNVVTRAGMKDVDLEGWKQLQPRGSNRATQLVPKRSSQGRVTESPDYKHILWQDKNPVTLAFNPEIAEKTCGSCHAGIVKSFLKSPMGGASGAHTQSQYRSWTGKTGPQSCGLWTGVLSGPEQASFTDENREHYNSHSTMPIPRETAYANQKGCNRCHVGCLDCHLDAARDKSGESNKGPHAFRKRPATLSCYGGGRSFSCHAGPLERRRGDGYIREEFTQATEEGVEVLKGRTDIHRQKDLLCLDCHEPNRTTGFHADLRRDVKCDKCHPKAVRDHAQGAHRKVDCASCHTALIGGYAFNFWSAHGPKGSGNPLTRIQDYQVGAIAPLIVKNPKGIWIPVHVVPHTSGNVRAEEVRLSKRLLFRNRPDSALDRRYYSNDSYAITGLVKGLDEKDRDTMAWLNLDRVAHATGRSRGCGDCHASDAQKIKVIYGGGSYKDVEDGEYTIIADEKGLRVTNFLGPNGGPMPRALEPLKDKWDLKGNFLLPPLKDRKRYEKIKSSYEEGKFVH